MRVVRLRGRTRLVEQGDVVSDLLHAPGPTHDLFDVLAAALAACEPGPSTAFLGFAAGGIVAPLRAAGYDGTVHAVDISAAGWKIFEPIARDWPGRVSFHAQDARSWLLARRSPLDAILEDLSVPGRGGHVKPGLSFGELPRLAHRKLAARGVVVTNLLPPEDRSFGAALRAVAAPAKSAVVVTGEEWENRVVVAGRRTLDGRAFGRALREKLEAIGSEEAGRIRVARVS